MKFEKPSVERNWLRFPVVSAASEYLVMGQLMRRNVLAYKAPQNNEGYDLICIHPDARHKPSKLKKSQVRVQVKSRYATDCDRGFPLRDVSLDAFDFLVIVFLNIGRFAGKHDGASGEKEPEYYTLPAAFVRKHHHAKSAWQKVRLGGLQKEIEPYKNSLGFEKIAESLGVKRPARELDDPEGRRKRLALLDRLFNHPVPHRMSEIKRQRRDRDWEA